ncbi:exocyst complex component exo70 [Dimargaris cristalligena]|uniref:Exocyst complex protein EXO70 n=1 Tax=Dimargaris cristalligena TaxID=215637 RepID=A0A4P9ZQ93_9FUNG|nr:exocyst complex component exo70 [Dimargaris cristalligena]RKP35644.1 Cullin repeat-like-containing domain protein [Dimargaris cristalligena]|eukprot:RKP35644.1 Cullin repeat-like-containing domain protein [Dimargaris cristalligena]
MGSAYVTNYLDLDEEHDELQFLQESLEQINQISSKARLARLGSLVKPIHQSSRSLGKMQQNVDDTIASLKNMVKYFDCVRDEEPIIKQGPNEDDLLPYLKSINNLQLANDFIKQVNMRSCERVSKQIKQLLEVGLQNLNELFKKWLQQYSEPIDPTKYKSPLDIPRPPPATLRLLEMLITYLSTSESEIGTTIDYTKSFIDIRTLYISKSMAAIYSAADTTRVQSTATVYQKGTSPFITLTVNLLKIAQAEHDFIESVLPGDSAMDVFIKTFHMPVKRYFESAEGLIQSARRTIQTEKFMLFDVFETLKFYQNELDKVLYLSPSERKIISNLIASMSTPLMTSFAEYMEEAKSMAKISMPHDGTIYEFSSSAMSHMKRLLDHQETVESMMVTLGDGHWGYIADSSMTAKPRKTFSGQVILKHYFMDILHLLTTSLEAKCKGSKKSGVSIVFLMNNYHYIAKNIMGSKLLDVLGENELRIYENLDWKYQDHFCAMWKSCVEYLADDNGGPMGLKNKLVGHDKMTIKDKFKHFNSTLDELLRNQQGYAIPDQDLRLNLMDRIREMLIPAYSEFMERYQHTEFAKNSGKYVRYTKDILDRTIQRLFNSP